MSGWRRSAAGRRQAITDDKKRGIRQHHWRMMVSTSFSLQDEAVMRIGAFTALMSKPQTSI